MRKVKLDSYLENALKENVDKLDIMKDVEVPDINEAWYKFEDNLKDRYDGMKNREKKSTKILLVFKRVSIAVACIMVFSFIFPFLYEMPMVKAFRFNFINTIVEKAEDLFIIKRTSERENDGKDNSEIDDMEKGKSNNLIFKDIEGVKEKIAFHLFVPEYLPDTYTLDEVELDVYFTGKELVTQVYSNKDSEVITIEQHTLISDIDEMINVEVEDSDAKILIINDLEVVIIGDGTGYKSASWIKDGYRLDINGDIEDDELIHIIEGLK